jgi:anti-sigma factor ChrR (cupin superfamily)
MNDVRDVWTDRLSEYVDGELEAAERAALEVHLQVCEGCARTVGELRAVVERAGSLEACAPEEDLWPGIEARLSRPKQARVFGLGAWLRGRRGNAPALYPVAAPRRWSFTFPQLAAAAVLLVMLSSATVWVMLTRQAATFSSAPGGTRSAPGATVQPAGFETTGYDAAIAELEQVLHQHRSELDTTTVRIIEQNLLIIDQATSQARRALAADPANPYLHGHLTEQLMRKIALLRQATAAVAAHG